MLKNLIETLKIEKYDTSNYVIKVVNKSLLLTDDDRLVDHQVTDGDILQVI
ncbi:YukD [Bacillus pseudomycoides]|nr:YukD [Bacillus pseudomycoides]EEM11408.1 YukD [Bacillus pseudomycoides]EEM17267.1 YukD [Bacillus pseudomycoides DSM 12442]